MGAAPSQPAQSTEEQEANKRTMLDFEQSMVRAQQDFDRCEANLKSYEERPPNCPSIDTNALRNHISSQIHNDFQFNFTMSEGTKYSAERINDESIVNDVNNFLSGKAYQISNLDSKNPSPGYVTKEECKKISELFPHSILMDQGDPNLGSENHICAIRQIQNSDDATFSNNVFWVPNPEMLPTRESLTENLTAAINPPEDLISKFEDLISKCSADDSKSAYEACQALAEKHYDHIVSECKGVEIDNENKLLCQTVFNKVKEIASAPQDLIPEDPKPTETQDILAQKEPLPLKGW